ncbi:tyrosine-type recombinase/integrase [Aliarcobacter lanthieri]|uniref:tyrosine-type recombinase/integrase n=1 Tax=Aliarcobacter lanthieri TaxID=1355374 RepID=UPI003AAF6E60
MEVILKEEYFSHEKDFLLVNWLYNKAVEIPDDFSLEKYSRNKSNNDYIRFLKIDSCYRIYVKMYIYSLLVEERHGENSITDEFGKIKEFIEFLIKEQFVFDIRDIKKSDFLSFVDKVKYLISNKFTLKEGININTGAKKISSIRKFLLNMFNEGVSELSFIQDIEVSKLIPVNSPEYFYEGEMLDRYYESIEKDYEDKRLSYPHLIEILETMTEWDDLELECLITILVNTGLRVSEALNLQVGCYSKATEEEYAAFLESRIDAEIIASDEKTIYWLDNYFASKTKKSEWTIGNPILIGQKTKEAIDFLIIHSADAREDLKGKHGESKIFATFRNNKAIVPKVHYFNYKKKKVCERLDIPKFSFHQFRHTFAKMLYDSGVPLAFIKKYLNHIYTDMTAHYTGTSMEDKMKTYIEFAESEKVESLNIKVKELHRELKNAIDSEDFQAMSFENRLDLLDMVIENSNLGINVMDHGICLLQNGTPCPNNYLDINSCIDELCGKFVVTEKSISYINNLIEYRTNAISELENLNFIEAANFNKKKLSQLNSTLNLLKKENDE